MTTDTNAEGGLDDEREKKQFLKLLEKKMRRRGGQRTDNVPEFLRPIVECVEKKKFCKKCQVKRHLENPKGLHSTFGPQPLTVLQQKDLL